MWRGDSPRPDSRAVAPRVLGGPRLGRVAGLGPQRAAAESSIYCDTVLPCVTDTLLSFVAGPGSYGDDADTFVTPIATASRDARRAAIRSKNFESALAILDEPAPMPPPIFCIVNAPAARSRR